MPGTIVVGSQFGDEGKGKIVDLLAKKADLVVRFNGGNNAGHTVVVAGKKYKFHLMPSGAIQGKQCCIAAGVALDPRVLKQEIDKLQGKVEVKLAIDPRTHVIMPWHNAMDAARENAKGKEKIGTTGRGIGPCYAERASRTGIRFAQVVDGKRLRERLDALYPARQNILKKVYGTEMPFGKEAIFNEYSKLGKEFEKYMEDVSMTVSKALKEGKNVLFEGAQGTFLDNDFGTYPYVTSSHPLAGAIFTGIGLGLQPIDRVIGIVKAYTTRVGSGPFATELQGSLANEIRERGQEFGTTTGRPRRVGWLDLVLVRTAVRLNGLTEIALTKLDVLTGLKEVQVCTEYLLEGQKVREMPADVAKWGQCKPVYKKLPGFELQGKEKDFGQLPEKAKEYMQFIEKELGIPIKIVSVGPDREETILR